MPETAISLTLFALIALLYCDFGGVISLRRWLMDGMIGWRRNDTRGSNARRVMGRISYVLVAVLLVDVSLNAEASPYLAGLLVGYACLLFGMKILMVLLVLTDQNFKPQLPRLFGDIVLSSLFTIAVFGYVFSLVGIQYTLDLPPEYAPRKSDYFYFAAVTFSTLGYGDFAPVAPGPARSIAAFLAVFGNLHLGLVAGSLMALLNRK
ncbi:MAG: ion channel [Pelagimonas sp.]|jgi:hypothetical protein|nr:ion channel [Pelagimonas sp.]